MRQPRRGEVWWGEMENIGRRPFLVVTRDGAIPVLTGIVCAPVTRTVRHIPTEVALGPEDDMPVACAASCDNLRTVPKAALTERITTLRPERLDALCRALRIAVDC